MPVPDNVRYAGWVLWNLPCLVSAVLARFLVFVAMKVVGAEFEE